VIGRVSSSEKKFLLVFWLFFISPLAFAQDLKPVDVIGFHNEKIWYAEKRIESMKENVYQLT